MSLIKPETPKPPEIPDHLWDGLRMYLLEGREVGDFLFALLSNNLVDSMARADEESFAALHDLVLWLTHAAPSRAWGSKERVDAWIEYKSEQCREEQRNARPG